MKAYKISEEEKNQLKGTEMEPNWYYNPVQDKKGDWFIFEVEHQHCGLGQEAKYIPPKSKIDIGPEKEKKTPMKAYKITEEERKQLEETEMEPSWYYNPVQDKKGDWFIFEVEHQHCGLGTEAKYVSPKTEKDI